MMPPFKFILVHIFGRNFRPTFKLAGHYFPRNLRCTHFINKISFCFSLQFPGRSRTVATRDIFKRSVESLGNHYTDMNVNVYLTLIGTFVIVFLPLQQI